MDGCSLNITVSALACAIAKGKTDDEISLLGVLFTQLGDCLTTIALQNEICERADENKLCKNAS